MNVKEILYREPPKELFHYTSQAGLLGIVKEMEIWATHTQYLNDPVEFRHAIDIVVEEILRMKERNNSSDHTEMLNEMEESIQGIETLNVCVASFSKNGDSLSQWRAYSGGVAGFAIRFSGMFLRAVIGDIGWLAPCQYTKDDQRALVRILLEDVMAEEQNPTENEKDDNDPWRIPGVSNLVNYLSRYAPLVKHQSFIEEEEWRIISRPLMCDRNGFGYRPGTSMLVPYYRVPLNTDNFPFNIEQIVIGPTPHPEQSRNSVRSLLLRHGLRDTQVVLSSVPYRNW